MVPLWIGPPPGRTTAELLPLESWGSPIGVLGRLGGAEEVLGANLRNLPMGVYLGQRDLPEGYLGQRALWIRVGSRVDGSQRPGGLLDVW